MHDEVHCRRLEEANKFVQRPPQASHQLLWDGFCFSRISQEWTVSFFWPLHIKNTPENKLTQYNTHNPRFTVRKGAVWKEPQVLYVHWLKCPTRWTESFTFQQEFIWWTLEKLFFFLKKGKKKRHVQDDGASPCQVLSNRLLTAFVSCSNKENKQFVAARCPCLFLFF